MFLTIYTALLCSTYYRAFVLTCVFERGSSSSPRPLPAQDISLLPLYSLFDFLLVDTAGTEMVLLASQKLECLLLQLLLIVLLKEHLKKETPA